jgi:hypothetical protein
LFVEDPGTTAIAAGPSKTFHVTERMRLRFESTFTNLMNHPNFAMPTTNVTSSSFGIAQSVQIAETGGNRTGQVSPRLDFPCRSSCVLRQRDSGYLSADLTHRIKKASLNSLLRGLCPVKHPAATLLELEDQRIRISSGKSRRIYFRNQRVGRRQVAAAFKTGHVQLLRKS